MIISIIVIYLLAMLIIGYIASKKVNDTDDYLMGGHSFGIIPMTGTYLATFFSALSLLGGVGMLYVSGISASWYPMAWALGSALGPIIAIRLRSVQFTTPTEYFYHRFGSRKLQGFGSLMTIVGLCFNLIVQFTAMGVVWHLATGRSMTEGLIIGTIIAILYTMMGGFFAVVWTDVVQSVIFIVSIIIGAVTVLTNTGGLASIYSQAALIDTAPAIGMANTSPGTMVTVLGGFTGISLFFNFLVQGPGTGTHPVYLQRMQASKDMKTALGMYKYAWLILIVIYICLNIIGVGGRVLIPTMPEGMKTDFIMPLIFLKYTSPIIAGLFFSGLLAAAMSTIDSNVIVISSCAADIAKQIKNDLSDKQLLWISRGAVLIVGIIVLLFSMSNLPMLITIAGYCFGILGLTYFMPLILGLYWKRANLAGAWACVLGGSVVFAICQFIYGGSVNGIPTIGIGIFSGMILMWIVSLVTPASPKELWGKYIYEKETE